MSIVDMIDELVDRPIEETLVSKLNEIVTRINELTRRVEELEKEREKK